MEEKRTPLEMIIGGFAMLIIGIVIVVKTSNTIPYPYSPFLKSDSGSVLGLVMILASLVVIGVGAFRMRGEVEDYESGPVEDFSERLAHEEKPDPAPAPIPVVAKVEKPIEKKIVYCPYCGTAQKEDYMSCESCGAGRKK